MTLVIDWIKQINIFTTLKLVVTTLWEWLLVFLNFETKVWWLLIALVVLFAILWIIIKIADSKDTNSPEWMQYTEDRFADWKWSWTWAKDAYGKYHVDNLVAHCPKCDTPMRHDEYDIVFHCSRCKYKSQHHTDNRDDVMVVIYDNIQRKSKN